MSETSPAPTILAEPAASSTSVTFTRFPGIAKPKGQAFTWEWSRLVQWLTQPTEETAEKKSLPAWAPAVFHDDYRKKDNVETVSLLVYDFDDKAPSLEAIAKDWEGVEGILHTTFSATEAEPRSRLVILLSRPVTPEEFVHVWTHCMWAMRARIPGDWKLDESCKDASRMWLVPARNLNQDAPPFRALHLEGKPLPVDDILEAERKRLLSTNSGKAHYLSRTLTGQPLYDGFNIDSMKVDAVNQDTSNDNVNQLIIRAVKQVTSAVNGSRNSTLAKQAFTLGGFIASGLIDESLARESLVKAALVAELPEGEALVTVQRGIEAGKAKPLVPQAGKKAKVRVTMTVAIDSLTTHPDWLGVLGFNAFDGKVYFLKPPPFLDSAYSLSRQGKSPEDNDFTHVVSWFERVYNVSPSVDKVVRAIVAAGYANTYHPVQSYLNSLTWDGVSRLDTWLETYCGVRPASEDERATARAFGRRWMISAVARVLRPGCKADAMLILEGEQGLKKSTALRSLVNPPSGESWFSDADLDLSSKDVYDLIQGTWVQEFAELESLNKAETGRIKQFLSVNSDKWRPPYERATKLVERQVIFAGTVNGSGYLRDRTGNRRFWPVLCQETCNWQGLARDRDSLWAEAVAAYREGEQWWLTDSEERLAYSEQAERVVIDPWQDTLAQWLQHKDRPEFVSLQDAFAAVGCPEAMQQTPNLASRITPLLASLGYIRCRTMVDGIQRRGFKRQEKPTSTITPTTDFTD